MELHEQIRSLRERNRLSQEAFAERMQVTRQAVQKWEAGTAQPKPEHLVRMAKLFSVSLDRLLLERDLRAVEEEQREIQPQYSMLHPWQKYAHDMQVEYRQCVEEGLDVAAYEPLFRAVEQMPDDRHRAAVADVLYDIVRTAPAVADYPYREPSDMEQIRACAEGTVPVLRMPDRKTLANRVSGAWHGRIAGCLLGKPVEGMRRDELHRFLRESGNFPMHRYILSADVPEDAVDRYRFPLAGRCYADTVPCAPVDDDTNYTVLAQRLISRYTAAFTPADVAAAWLSWQPKDAYCTAERVAYCNFVNGYMPPDSAVYKNHYREWIGAQIRGDYFGYIHPCDPAAAAEMAWRDASISHIKNGIYGEMWVAAMLACAAGTTVIQDVIRGGLAQIPQQSRLHEEIAGMVADYEAGVGAEKAIRRITERYDDRQGHDWCHTISNARIVTAALLYGGGDYAKSVCLAVQTGFDTDCNGATVGSVIGMMHGRACIPEAFTRPLNDQLDTSLFGMGRLPIASLVEQTCAHIAGFRGEK